MLVDREEMWFRVLVEGGRLQDGGRHG
ncbi:hypothetical protein L195_g064204, partial [Trifolium pratense]